MSTPIDMAAKTKDTMIVKPTAQDISIVLVQTGATSDAA
eukprot:CAMPEP_0172596178 /NCGR_PEP_ID=MMETSP1068-20121228/15942_1 /TAXON_ID=35684 /ORGANISM="Pseudopedinella elastica, Strain CCMP716" /LENGTH=38 /DNA_ID= /DNA_START= /DNA_END= /DNA_ORIENTATION=